MKTKNYLHLTLLIILLSSCSAFRNASFQNNKAVGKAGIIRVPQFTKYVKDKNGKAIDTLGTFMWSHYDATKRGSLMYIDKKGTWDMAFELGSTEFVDLIIENTHTCYLGDRTQKHHWGFGCGSCPACELRSKGYKAWEQERTK